MKTHGSGASFAYWRAPGLPGVDFAEGRGAVATTEAPHFHAEGQMVLLVEGERLVERESRQHRLGDGELIWIAPNAVHTSRAMDGKAGGRAHFLHAYLPPRLLRRLSPRRPVDTVRRLAPPSGIAATQLLGELRSTASEAAALAALQALFALEPTADAQPDAVLTDAVARARDWWRCISPSR